MEICITKESRVEEGFGHLKPPNDWEAKERDPIGRAESGRHGLGDCAGLPPLNQTPDPQVFPRPGIKV